MEKEASARQSSPDPGSEQSSADPGSEQSRPDPGSEPSLSKAAPSSAKPKRARVGNDTCIIQRAF